MRNYIKSEIYKIINRKYYQMTVLAFIILSMAVNIVLKLWGVKITNDLFSTSIYFFSMILVTSPSIILIMMDIIMGDEIKNKTLNNAITNGISKDKIMITKIISIFIFFILFLIVNIVAHILMSTILFGGNKEGFKLIHQYVLAYLSLIPIWIGFISFYLICFVTIENQIISSAVALAFVYIVPIIASAIVYFKPKLVLLNVLQPLRAMQMLIERAEGRRLTSLCNFTIILGIGISIISTIILITVFRKKDY